MLQDVYAAVSPDPQWLQWIQAYHSGDRFHGYGSCLCCATLSGPTYRKNTIWSGRFPYRTCTSVLLGYLHTCSRYVHCIKHSTASSDCWKVMVYACGVGHHATYILATNPATYISWAKSAVAVEVIYCTSVVFPKLSILAMYLRLFVVKRVYRYIIFTLMFIVAANGVAGDFTSLLSCRPLATRWNPALGGDCINVTNYWRFISLANIISDIAMLVFPLPFIWKLHVSPPQKVGLTILFLTGSL